jgi:hypothetical protein
MEPEHLDEVLLIETSSSLTPWSKEMFLEELRNPLARSFIYRVDEPQGHLLGIYLFQKCGRNRNFSIYVHPFTGVRELAKIDAVLYGIW